MTLYDAQHFFVPNALKRYSLGTKNKDLKLAGNGSLTIYVQADSAADENRANWLPAPSTGDSTLYLRAYWPKIPVIDGTWLPPTVVRLT